VNRVNSLVFFSFEGEKSLFFFLDEMSQLVSDLTKSIRQTQRRIDESSKDFIQIQQINQKLIDFERLFINEHSK